MCWDKRCDGFKIGGKTFSTEFFDWRIHKKTAISTHLHPAPEVVVTCDCRRKGSLPYGSGSINTTPHSVSISLDQAALMYQAKKGKLPQKNGKLSQGKLTRKSSRTGGNFPHFYRLSYSSDPIYHGTVGTRLNHSNIKTSKLRFGGLRWPWVVTSLSFNTIINITTTRYMLSYPITIGMLYRKTLFHNLRAGLGACSSPLFMCCIHAYAHLRT